MKHDCCSPTIIEHPDPDRGRIYYGYYCRHCLPLRWPIFRNAPLATEISDTETCRLWAQLAINAFGLLHRLGLPDTHYAKERGAELLVEDKPVRLVAAGYSNGQAVIASDAPFPAFFQTLRTLQDYGITAAHRGAIAER